jgi:hypothetical protein
MKPCLRNVCFVIAALGLCALNNGCNRRSSDEAITKGSENRIANDARMSPDRALSISLMALANESYQLWKEYKIIITYSVDKNQWIIWFVALPETPGMDITVFVASDGTSTLLPGR